MNRTSFLKALIASLVIGRLPLVVTKQFRKIYLLQCFVAGFRHYEGMNLLQEMKDGDLLELVREPANTYDECAIALHWQGKKIGFIPAATNEMLSYLLDVNALSLFAVITHLEKNAKPWENVAVAVYFIQEVNKELPAHASHLTLIEAPHYRTLHKKEKLLPQAEITTATYEQLFDSTNRVINLATIPDEHRAAKEQLEKSYSKLPVILNEKGRYVLIPDDGIYSFMYDIGGDIRIVRDKAGERFIEFFLV